MATELEQNKFRFFAEMLSLTRQTGRLQAGCTRAVAEVTKSDMSDLVGIYFESAAVDVDCSHMTASSSASWS